MIINQEQYYKKLEMEKVMRNLKSDLCSREHLDLEIQRIVNRKMYEENTILKDTYSRVEQEILKDIEKEKAKYNVT